MTNREKYDEIFINVMEIKAEDLNEELKYNSISLWDSVGHMQLIMELEANFDISIDTEDVLDFNSYFKGMEILKKYNVEI